MTIDITPTVAEAERLLEEARRAEADRAEEIARQVEEDSRRQADFDREAALLVSALEARVKAVAADAANVSVAPDLELRRLARGWLHGFSAPYGREVMTQEEIIAMKDRTAAMLLDVSNEAAQMYEDFTNDERRVHLCPDHPLARRIDTAEVIAWRAFVTHVRTLAGE
jgi:hypothetical protein